MIVKDAMHNFELFQPTQLDDVFAILDKYGKDAWKMSGGHDSLSWFKDRNKRPKAVVDLSRVAGLAGVKDMPDGGLEIGALTTLADLAKNPAIRAKFRVLAEAASKVASPQIRNTGTIGGNAAQDARCWYYRYGQPCLRAGGTICFAGMPDSVNREHAIFDRERCLAVNPGDLAPALVALDARFVMRSSAGERVLDPDQFFVGPKVDVTRLTAVKPEEILVAIRIPRDWAGARFYFEKAAERNSWDFAMVNVAAAIVLRDGVVERSRIVCNAVAATPKRIAAAEEAIKGKAPDAQVAELAGQAASRGTRPLKYNRYKVPLMASLVTRAVRNATA